MERSAACQSCGKKSLISDDVTGNLICASCSCVQEYNNFEAQTFGINGPTGTTIRIGTTGSGNNYSYTERKVYKAKMLIDDFLFKLNLCDVKINQVKSIIETITEEKYGEGDWFTVFIGACAYVVMRKDSNPLPITEVAALVNCDIHELGRMIARVVDFLKLKLPDFDIVNLFQHAIRNCPSFSSTESDKMERMLKQGVFLVQCLVKWFVTTGRRPVQVVVAVLVFLGQLNQVDVKIEDVADELNVPVVTCRLRYKELLERLVDVARAALPWGKDVTVKNIVKNAPYVIQYMEMKSMAKSGKEQKCLANVRFDMDDFVGDCMREGVDYLSGYRPFEDGNDSQYFEAERSHSWSAVDLEKLKMSPECMSMIYSKLLEEVSDFSSMLKSGKENRRRGNNDFLACIDWWKGKSELSKKLFLQEILEKDVGMDVMPPSFIRGCLANQKRREKIAAAKIRIDKIMCPSKAGSGDWNDLCLSNCVKSGKRRRKHHVDVDWEDFIIETLLLHQVKEEEIEKGHYNTLLDLHVFKSGCL